jgi:hypothetical protein
VNQQADLFRGFTAERFFATPSSDVCWNVINQHVLAIDLENLIDKLCSASLRSAHRTFKHDYLR